MDFDIIEAAFNPVRIYGIEFYGISLWTQLIAGGIKSSFTSRTADSRDHERGARGTSKSSFSRKRSNEHYVRCLWKFILFHFINNCASVVHFTNRVNKKRNYRRQKTYKIRIEKLPTLRQLSG